MSVTYHYVDVPLQKIVDTLEVLQKFPHLYCEMKNAGIPDSKRYLLLWKDTDVNLTGTTINDCFGVHIQIEANVISIDKGSGFCWNGQSLLSDYLRKVEIETAWTD